MASRKRLEDELDFFRRDPLVDFSAGPLTDDLRAWSAILSGPNESPYAGGTFFLSIDFPTDYPLRPPIISFTTKIYHPNLSMTGPLQLGILKDQWSPKFTLAQVLIEISNLVENPDLTKPLVPEIAQVYKTNTLRYEAIAREWTIKFATK